MSSAVEIYNIDDLAEVSLPSGGEIELEISTKIIKAHAWVIDDPGLRKLQIVILKPRGSGIGMYNRSAFHVSCTRDCKPGDSYELNLRQKELTSGKILQTRKLKLNIVEGPQVSEEL